MGHSRRTRRALGGQRRRGQHHYGGRRWFRVPGRHRPGQRRRCLFRQHHSPLHREAVCFGGRRRPGPAPGHLYRRFHRFSARGHRGHEGRLRRHRKRLRQQRAGGGGGQSSGRAGDDVGAAPGRRRRRLPPIQGRPGRCQWLPVRHQRGNRPLAALGRPLRSRL